MFHFGLWADEGREREGGGWRSGGGREVPKSLWIEALEKNQAAIGNNSLFPPSSRAAGCNPLWSSPHSKWRKRFCSHPSDSIGNNKIINHMNWYDGYKPQYPHVACVNRPISRNRSVLFSLVTIWTQTTLPSACCSSSNRKYLCHEGLPFSRIRIGFDPLFAFGFENTKQLFINNKLM